MKIKLDEKKDRNELLSQIFDCIVINGLEKITTRQICTFCGLTASSLYYWFADKDEIVLEATICGMNRIVDELFATAYSFLSDISRLFSELPKEILKYKKELRVVYQVVTSPQYGDRLRQQVAMLPLAYESFARVVADQVNISFEKIEPFTLLYISAASNYILWEDEKKFDVQFQYLKNSIMTLIEKETSSYGS